MSGKEGKIPFPANNSCSELFLTKKKLKFRLLKYIFVIQIYFIILFIYIYLIFVNFIGLNKLLNCIINL